MCFALDHVSCSINSELPRSSKSGTHQSVERSGPMYSAVASKRDENHAEGDTSRSNNGKWRVQRHRKGARELGALNNLTPKLYGSKRVTSRAFHLSGIGLDCTPEDVVLHCKQRRVAVTGCVFIRTRLWGTHSAKLYVAENCTVDVVKDGFWPSLIRCRKWDLNPP